MTNFFGRDILYMGVTGMKKRLRIRFHGRVQGVGFRYTAYHLAQALELTGWVENCFDGTVLCEVQGDKISIDEMLGKLSAGRYIDITGMDINELQINDKERGFNIRE